jgi:hypothetical protein
LTAVKKLKINEDFENLLNEEFDLLSEAVTVSITGDTPEEVNQMFGKMFDKSQKQNTTTEETVSWASEDATQMLTLGKKYTVSDIRTDSSTLSNADINEILENKREDVNYLKDNNGKVRIFMLRRAAAKEAHQQSGVVYPYKNGGYVVKLNEEKEDVSVLEKIDFLEERRSSRGSINGTFLAESTGSSSANAETQTRHKITLKEIWSKKKYIEESIDKGIEPGLSMAGAGESPARDMGEKLTKKKKVAVVEGGGETTATSISDQKEDELKKQGINLQSFKAKRPI